MRIISERCVGRADGFLGLGPSGTDAGHSALRFGNPIGTVDEMTDLSRGERRLHIGTGDVLEEQLQVEILLVVRSDGRTGLLPDDR